MIPWKGDGMDDVHLRQVPHLPARRHLRARLQFDHLSHAAFFVLVAAATLSLLTTDGSACPYTLALTAALATLYTTGLVLWHRWQRWRAAWLVALVAVWLALLAVAPGSLPQALAWCALPLTCVALRALPSAATVPVVAAFTGALVFTFAGRTGMGQADAMVAPVVALWTTAALYHRQRDDATKQQRLIGELQRTRAELARQQREAGVLAERARIARDLHDSLAQQLAGSRMLLQAADRDWQRSPETARTRVRAVVDALGDDLLEARRMIADLTPPALEHGDLGAALTALCARAQLAGAASNVRYESHAVSEPLPVDVTATMLRVAQEAVANARDHAAATSIVVTLHRADARVVLCVRDDGVGFAEDRVVDTSGRGFGLPAMRERLQGRGGTLTVDSVPGRGTTVTATLPLRPTGAKPVPQPSSFAIAA